MSNQPSNPIDVWRNLINQWEQNVDKMANTMMGTDEFSKSANIASQFQLRAQSAFSEQMAKQLSLMSIPTKEDVEQLGMRLQNIDERLRRMEETLIHLAKHVDPSAMAKSNSLQMPPRTRKSSKTAEKSD